MRNANTPKSAAARPLRRVNIKMPKDVETRAEPKSRRTGKDKISWFIVERYYTKNEVQRALLNIHNLPAVLDGGGDHAVGFDVRGQGVFAAGDNALHG